MQDGNIDSDTEDGSEPNLTNVGHESASLPSQVSDQLGNTVCWKEIKVNDKIMFRKNDSDTWTTGTVVSRGGKVGGKYETWYNVDTGEDRRSVDLNAQTILVFHKFRQTVVHRVVKKNLEEGEHDANNITSVNKTETVYVAKKKCSKTVKAQLDEILKMQDFDTYEVVVNDVGQEQISIRWIITTKGSGEIKARLVACGFEEACDQQTDSPTVSKSVIRVFMAICVALGWLNQTTGIK